MMRLLKSVLLFWPRFVKEGYYTYKYYRVTKSIEAELLKEGLRVDWIGRIYTVLNLKEEAMQQPDLVQQSMVFQSLEPISKVLLKHGISNESYPTLEKVSDRSYLLTLYPDNDHFRLPNFFANLAFAGSVAGIVWAITTFI